MVNSDKNAKRMFLKSVFPQRSCLALTLLCVLTILLSGCATTQEAPQRKPPDARLGPVLNLLKVSIGPDKVRVVSGPSNLVHVLIASTALRQVLDIVVQPDGTIEQQVIRSNVSPSTLDGAFDAQGRLHVLMDAEHAVLEDGQWRTSISTAWQNAGINVQNPAFAHGAHNLIWIFSVLGNDMGAKPGRWVWRGSGGGYPAGGFVVYPWYEKTTKAVLVSDAAGRETQWNILDPQSERDTLIVNAASDASGNIHLVYASGYNLHLAGNTSFLDGLLGRHAAEVKLYYARLAIKDLQSAGSGKPDTPGAVKEIRPLGNISGVHQLDWHWTHPNCALAVDPVTGTAMLGNYWLVKGERWMEVKKSSPFPSLAMQIAAAGNDRFHAIAIGNIDARFGGREGIMYSMFANGEWSGPLWLSITGTASVFNPAVVGMSGVKSGNAFVAWATENGIVGRWIEPNQ